jgi:lipopolysaccharide biosynthesis protein
MESTLVRLIAFYLPQFHPIPENDAWWGRGFTEWTNVVRARPLFPSHYQPHVPANLGFYDLRLPETRQVQADLAGRHSVHAFCYWHYWFNGRRLLERPFQEVLRSGAPDFPFCLAWANETWSRRWLGEERDVLLKQTYSPADDRAHARWLTEAFADPRYVRVDGRPVFLIYKPLDLPEPERTTNTLRTEVIRAGLSQPLLVGVNAHCVGKDCRALGFDETLNFEPQLGALAGTLNDGLKVHDDATARRLMAAQTPRHPIYPCVYVGWDNTPRRGKNAVVITGGSPQRFGDRVQDAIRSVLHREPDHRLVFINAWNEWAEGNHLEPDQRYGLQYLEALQQAYSATARNVRPRREVADCRDAVTV